MSIFRIYTEADGESPGALAPSTRHGRARATQQPSWRHGRSGGGAGQEKGL